VGDRIVDLKSYKDAHRHDEVECRRRSLMKVFCRNQTDIDSCDSYFAANLKRIEARTAIRGLTSGVIRGGRVRRRSVTSTRVFSLQTTCGPSTWTRATS